MCDELIACETCVNSTSACVFCDDRCYSRASNASGDAFVLERCFGGATPIRALAECPVAPSTMFLSTTTATMATTTTTTSATTATGMASTMLVLTTTTTTIDAAVDSTALTIGLLAAFLILCCLVSSLLLACYCLRSVAASRANDANDADVSLFDDYEEEEAARLDLASRLVPLDASRTASVESATSVAQSPPRDEFDVNDDDNEIIDASTLHDTMADLAPHVKKANEPAVLEALMADLADVGQHDDAHANELAWQPDPATAEAISKRISVIAASSSSSNAGTRPFVKRSSVRASISKRASDRAILRASVSKKTSERDMSQKRGVRKRASTQFADLAADEDAKSSPLVPDVGDSDSDEVEADDAAESNDELPQTPAGVQPGNVFLYATEATHLAASGKAVSRVARVVQRAVESAQVAEKAALAADDAPSAAAIRSQMIASAQATKKYVAAPSQATSSALGDVLARLISMTIVYDKPAGAKQQYADELLSDSDDNADAGPRKMRSNYADELKADSASEDDGGKR